MKNIPNFRWALFVTLCLLISPYPGHCEEGKDVDDPLTLVETKQGTLSGLAYTSRKGRTYYGWTGVGYGKVKERFAVSANFTRKELHFCQKLVWNWRNLSFFEIRLPRSRILGRASNPWKLCHRRVSIFLCSPNKWWAWRIVCSLMCTRQVQR